MSKIRIESSCSSSATHHLTQSSTTLNRRYVSRPSNKMIEEAATESASESIATPATPSRLVNLRVHTADLEAARAREEAARRAENERISEGLTVYPAVVEFGRESVKSANSASAINENATPATEPVTDSTVDTKTLAMNIAADYATASLGASAKEYNDSYQQDTTSSANADNTETTSDVDAIARAASEAIASIRIATDPVEVSEQISSLKTFAESIKSNPGMPEMRELGDTIEKFVNIAMKSTKVQEETKHKATTAAPKVALSPKVNRAATKVTRSSAKVMAASNRTKAAPAARATNKGRAAGYSTMRNAAKTGNLRPTMHKPTPEELKDRAIQQALESVATMDEPHNHKTAKPAVHAKTKRKGSGLRFALAFGCAAACVAGVISFVSANMPDISVRVAAMQTGIEAAYPSYVPRDYSLDNINSEDGKISITFAGPDGSAFTLIEEKSSWDSSALLRNYVEPTWGDNYATTHEQGITIYIANDTADAAWVNGGVLYKIVSSGNSLTKKQVRSIVVSL